MNERLKENTVWGAGTLTACTGLYLITNRITDGFEGSYKMYFDWELGLALVPWMILVYCSFYGLLVLAFLTSKTREDLMNLSYSMVFCALVAAVCFVLFPGELGYTRAEDAGVFKPLYDLLFVLDKPTNLFPSLHVAFSYVAVVFFVDQTSRVPLKLLAWTWLIAICFSVVLVHQHHVFDIFSGLALGWLARRVI